MQRDGFLLIVTYRYSYQYCHLVSFYDFIVNEFTAFFLYIPIINDAMSI